MIEVGSALGVGKDTSLVGLEDHLVSLDGNSEGLLVEGGLHLVGVVGGDVSVVGDSDGSGGGSLVSAGALDGVDTRGVGVDGLELGLVAILVVLVGVSLETTIASVVAVLKVGAINELLLGEGEEFTSGDLVGTLKGTGGGESPA